MALTKGDLTQVKNIVEGVVTREVDNLAKIVAKGFESVDKRFEQVDARFEQIDKRFEVVDKHFEKIEGELSYTRAEMTVMRGDMEEIKRHFVYRQEFEDALARIVLLEKRAGIKSGKNHR